jgi:hypothetical protein
VLVLAMIRHGYKEKLFAALALFLRLAVSFILAMTLYRFLSSLIVKNVSFISEYMAIRVTFLATMWGFYVLTTEMYERWMEPEHVQVPKVVDRVGGIIFGGLAGAMLVGMVLISLACVPIARLYRAMPIDKSGLYVDMGEGLIEQYAHLCSQMGGEGRFDTRAVIEAYLTMDAEEFPAPRRDTAEYDKILEKILLDPNVLQITRGQKAVSYNDLKSKALSVSHDLVWIQNMGPVKPIVKKYGSPQEKEQRGGLLVYYWYGHGGFLVDSHGNITALCYRKQTSKPSGEVTAKQVPGTVAPDGKPHPGAKTLPAPSPKQAAPAATSPPAAQKPGK